MATRHIKLRGRGVELLIEFTVYVGTSDTPADLTGRRIVFQLLSAHSATATPATPLAEYDTADGDAEIEVVDAEAGRVNVTVPSGDTDRTPGRYFYSLSCPDAGAEDLFVEGRFVIPRARVALGA